MYRMLQFVLCRENECIINKCKKSYAFLSKRLYALKLKRKQEVLVVKVTMVSISDRRTTISMSNL